MRSSPVRFSPLVALLLCDPTAGAILAQETVLAAVRFDDGPERYAGTPYYWLGRFDLRLTIDVAPAAGHVLELSWGSKRDRRDAIATIAGHDLRIQGGGHDGFEWLRTPLPQGLQGDRYEIALRRGAGKPGFVAAARLVRIDGAAGAGSEPRAIRVELCPASEPREVEAFPARRAFWDTPIPPRSEEHADPAVERAFVAAERNGRQANEMLFRCRRFVDGWLAHADPVTELIPRNLDQDADIWNAADAAADNYPFMVLTCALTDRELFEGRMRRMLATETRLTSRVGRLPDTWSFSRQAFARDAPDLPSIVFGGSEYVKDGLLPLCEWLGPSPWSERMLGILDDLWARAASIDTPAGALISTDVEVNGEQLQATSRVFWMTGERRYLDLAIRLGDYYLLGGHHPTRDFESLKLRDHGCEIVSGLTELYVATSFAAPDKREQYRQPVHEMLDRMLEVGRDPRGMLYDQVDPRTGAHSPGICDTWGYNYNGVYAVYLVDGVKRYRDAVRHVLTELAPRVSGHPWGSADSFADCIEGAINLFQRERIDGVEGWLDQEIRRMWQKQAPDGVIEGWHGDGNSARTAIMYALYKTRGVTARPWREDLRFGAVEHGRALCVSVVAAEPWRGEIVFDRPRHKEHLHLPLDYPRINQFPEWFTVEPDARHRVTDASTGLASEHDGARLRGGLPVELRAGVELRWLVEPLDR